MQKSIKVIVGTKSTKGIPMQHLNGLESKYDKKGKKYQISKIPKEKKST